MSFISFGVSSARKKLKNYEYRAVLYTTRLTLDNADLIRMGWEFGDRLVIDHDKCEIRKAVGWEYGPTISEGPHHSGKVFFQSVEPGMIHQKEKKRHCRRAVCEPEKGIVKAGEIDNSLNKSTFEKRKGKRPADGRKQTLWKPSKRLKEAYEMNRAENGHRIYARDFRHTANLRETPDLEER